MNDLNAVEAYVAAALAATLALLGVAVLVVAVRRRRGSARVCAGCDYPLEGLPATSTRCPECGRDLAAPGATAIGRRRRDWLSVVAGLALCLPAMVGLAIYAARMKTAVTAVVAPPPPAPAVVFTPSPFVGVGRGLMPATQPAFASLGDAALADAILADPAPPEIAAMLAMAADRATPSRDHVWPGDEPKRAWVERLLAVGTALQADASKPFPDHWATFTEKVLPLVSPDRYREYLRRGVPIEVTMRRRVDLDALFPVRVLIRPRISAALARQVKCRLTTFTFGPFSSDRLLSLLAPMPVEQLGENPRFGGPFSVGLDFFRFDAAARAVPPGEHRATLAIQVSMPLPQFDWVERIERTVTLRRPRPLGPPTPEQAAIDAKLAASLRVADAATSPDGTGLTWDGGRVRLAITLVNPPEDVVANAHIFLGGERWSLDAEDRNPGRMTWHRGETTTHVFERKIDKAKDFVGQPLRVEFAGMPYFGDLSFDERDWWPGVIHIDDVMLRDVSPGAAATPPTTPLATPW